MIKKSVVTISLSRVCTLRQGTQNLILTSDLYEKPNNCIVFFHLWTQVGLDTVLCSPISHFWQWSAAFCDILREDRGFAQT